MTWADIDLSHVSMVDKWILYRFDQVLKNVTANMEKYEFALVGNELYSFIWDDFCSWYIELSKAGLQSEDDDIKCATRSTLVTVLSGIVRLLHPFMPFVSEEIYLAMPHEKESINLEAWPTQIAVDIDTQTIADMQQLLTMISAVREIKKDYHLKPSTDISIIVKDMDGRLNTGYPAIHAILAKMCHADWICEETEEEMVSRSILNGTVSVPLASVMNIEEEIQKTEKEIQKLEGEIKRGEGMLKNENFIAKAPQMKIDSEKEKLENYKAQHHMACERLKELKNKK